MSLILSSPVAPQALPAAAASQTGRNGSQDRNDADSFGAVLRRSQESTEKTPGKLPEKIAVQRHPQDRDISKKTEQSDPASALVLAFIALEPRLAAAPASTTPSDATGAVAVALGTDASLSATTLMTTTPGQSTREQLALAASGQNVTDEQHGVIAPLTNLAVPGLQDDAAPIVLANATTAASPHALDGDAPVILVSAAAETSPRLTAQQIALATTGQREPASSALLSTKNAATDNSSTVRGTENTGKIASQAALSDIGATAQQSQQGDTASDSRDGKFSVKPDLRRSEIPTAVVAANIADAATNTNITPADQFSISASAAVNTASMLQQIPAGTTPQIAIATPVSLPLAPPVGSNEWGDALGKQVAWMGNANHQVAELQLNPAGLGPLKITLTINNHQAEALFVSAHPAVRAAVEAALPQLRTNLADNGISLGNTSVSADTQQQQQSAFAQDQAGQPSQARYRPDSVGALNTVDDLSLPDTAPSVSSSRNNVDIFA